MAQLRQDIGKFTALDTEIVVVGPEAPDAFEKYFVENNLPLIGLPDPDHSVLKLYGQEIKLFKFGRMPAMAVVDKQGVVRFVHYGKSMSDIPKNEEVLASLKEFDQQQT